MEETGAIKDNSKELLKINGKTRGENLKLDGEFILKRKGEEGLDLLEKEMTRLGFPIKYRQIKTGEWYPIGAEILSFLTIKKLFAYDDEKITEMGAGAAKFSLFLRLFMKYFVSLNKVAKEAPRIWREYYDIGDLKIETVNEEKKEIVLRLENFNTHPVYCQNLKGYFSRVVQMVVKSPVFCQEVKCLFKGDDYHQYVLSWGNVSANERASLPGLQNEAVSPKEAQELMKLAGGQTSAH